MTMSRQTRKLVRPLPSDYQDCQRSAHKFEYDYLPTEDQKGGTKLKTLVDLVERNWHGDPLPGFLEA